MSSNISHTKKLALSALITALSVTVMFLGKLTPATFAMPALSGALLIVIVVHLGKPWALAAFAAVSILTFLLSDKDMWILYLLFFGYYPIIKAVIEKLNHFVLEYLLKLICFNGAAASAYFLAVKVFSLPVTGIAVFGDYAVLGMLAVGNAVFLIFDYALSAAVRGYVTRLSPKISKMLK